jgi:hypothetical protein
VSDHDRLVGAFREVFNLTEEQAERAVRGRDVRSEAGYDGAQRLFEDVFNMSPKAARAAAQGRMSLSEARDFWSGGGGRNDIRDPGLRLAQEALANMTDAEVDQMYLEEQARKRRTPTKKAAPAKQPAGKRTTTISETTTQRPGRR